ncbi:DUF2071 domain-containing protein [Streptomyces sp. NPDC096033]|uniref:DUF2071 domain-containing protein n=1 Tax=Streptomyces sp. NPDC096033 TaxID=3366071 RepID=UPI00381097BA
MASTRQSRSSSAPTCWSCAPGTTGPRPPRGPRASRVSCAAPRCPSRTGPQARALDQKGTPVGSMRRAATVVPGVRVPVLSRRWRRQAVVHWPYRHQDVQALLPPGLEADLFKRRAWLSLTPFVISAVRVCGVPMVPDCFPETNLRTYVRHRGAHRASGSSPSTSPSHCSWPPDSADFPTTSPNSPLLPPAPTAATPAAENLGRCCRRPRSRSPRHSPGRPGYPPPPGSR